MYTHKKSYKTSNIASERCDIMRNQIEVKLGAIEQKIAESYKVKGGLCKRCQRYCKENGLPQHGPISFFNVGRLFESDRYKVVFVGKNHWYDKADLEEMSFLAPSKFRDARTGGVVAFLERLSIFWGYIQDMARQLYPEEEDEVDLLDHISITNITKCNTTTDYRDTTPYYLTDNCVEILEEEIKALRPKHLVFLTGRGYDSYIDSLDLGYALPPKDVTERTYKRPIKNQYHVWWWHREFQKHDKVTMHLLRTRHPQGAPKGLVTEIVKWIQKKNLQTT